MLPIGYEIVAKKIKEGTRKSKHKIVLSNEKLMCRSSTELLFVFVCLFSACKIQASIHDLLVSFLYLKLHFIFALYLHFWHAILLKNFLEYSRCLHFGLRLCCFACNMFSVQQVCVCLVFAWVLGKWISLFSRVFWYFLRRRTQNFNFNRFTGRMRNLRLCYSVCLRVAQKIYTHQCTLTPRYIRTHARTHTHGRTHTHTIAQLE